jgi:3',5'-cyclic AMP phosphodiesterase CpdA
MRYLFLFLSLLVARSQTPLLFSGAGTLPVPMRENFVFVWASDSHYGRNNENVTLSENFWQMTNYGPAFIVVTGDLTDNAAATNTLNYCAMTNSVGVPVWSLAGNHDACPEVGATNGPCSESYSNHFYFVGTNHFVFDYGAVLRFIGFDSKLKREAPDMGFGKVDDGEFNWLTNELQTAVEDGKKTVVLTHYPLRNTWGNNIKVHQAEIISAVSNAGNVVAFLSGHRHHWGASETNAGVIYINGPGLAYSEPSIDSPYSANGGFFKVTAANRSMTFDLITANHPTYTPRPVQWFVAY